MTDEQIKAKFEGWNFKSTDYDLHPTHLAQHAFNMSRGRYETEHKVVKSVLEFYYENKKESRGNAEQDK